MGRLSAPLLALALGAIVAVALTSCGGSGGAKLLPGNTAKEIEANLEQVREFASEGECIGAENAAQAIGTQVQQLGGVDKQLKQALREGAARLSEVVADCEEEPREETEAVESAEEAPEATEKAEKPVKPEKTKPPRESETAPAETTPEKTTPAAPEKGTEGGHGEAPPATPGGGTGAPSGGVSPSAPAGGG